MIRYVQPKMVDADSLYAASRRVSNLRGEGVAHMLLDKAANPIDRTAIVGAMASEVLIRQGYSAGDSTALDDVYLLMRHNVSMKKIAMAATSPDAFRALLLETIDGRVPVSSNGNEVSIHSTPELEHHLGYRDTVESAADYWQQVDQRALESLEGLGQLLDEMQRGQDSADAEVKH